MAIEIAHPFVSNKADGSDATLVQPSNWNEAHDFTMATARFLGRLTGGAGAVEELTAAQVAAAIESSLSSEFASGTRLTFQQTAAPTGWTKDTSHNNKAMRLVSGTVGTGGSTAFTSVFTSRTIAEANLPSHTHSFSATSSSNGSHTHTYANAGGTDSVSRGTSSSFTYADASPGSTSSDGSHTHTVSGTTGNGSGSGTAMDFAVQYVDFTISQKD